MDREQKPIRNNVRRRKKVCAFCAEKCESIDFKNVEKLRRFVSERGKILPRRVMGTCAKHQRELTTAIKRARQVALLPYDAEVTRLQKAKHFVAAKPEKVEKPELEVEEIVETAEEAVEAPVEEAVETVVEEAVEAPVEEAPAVEAPAEEAPVEEVPAEEKPADAE